MRFKYVYPKSTQATSSTRQGKTTASLEEIYSLNSYTVLEQRTSYCQVAPSYWAFPENMSYSDFVQLKFSTFQNLAPDTHWAIYKNFTATYNCSSFTLENMFRYFSAILYYKIGYSWDTWHWFFLSNLSVPGLISVSAMRVIIINFTFFIKVNSCSRR